MKGQTDNLTNGMDEWTNRQQIIPEGILSKTLYTSILEFPQNLLSVCVLDVMRVFTAGWRRAQGYKEGETTRQWCSGSGTVTPAWFPTCVITGTNRQTHDNTATHGALLISQDIYIIC